MTVRYSHPPEDEHEGVALYDHLRDVANRVEHIVHPDAETPAGESICEVVRTLAYVHDFGKATTFFQQYLGVQDGEPEFEEYRYHAPIGAVAAYYALDVRGFDTETCLAGFVAVAKHHGSLPDVAEYVYGRTHRREGISPREQNPAERQQTAIAKQLQDIDEHVPELASQVFDDATDGKGEWAAFLRRFVDLLGEISAIVATGSDTGFDPSTLSESCYGLVVQCWSSLILADKTSAARAPADARTYAAERPAFQQLDEHVHDIEAEANADQEGARAERLDYYRSRAREAVLDNVVAFADGAGSVATLTLPTGMGKTLTGLSAALDLRNRLDDERIVYALPFTSVIDQVVDEVKDIYQTDSAGRLLTAHHHLEETAIRGDVNDDDADDEDLSDDIAGMLAESWRAGLTVTTFVQFFESLAGPRNRQAMKLPALRDSVVVLDEPQSLPLDWWKLVPRLIEVLTDQYGATVIAMTATQPQLFDDATELVDDPDMYFDAVERVTYKLDESAERYLADRTGAKDYPGAASELRGAVAADESALAVCNTIDSARELTEHVVAGEMEFVDVAESYSAELEDTGDPDAIDFASLADRVETEGEHAVLHLSTRLRPVDRLTLVETAKELADRDYTLVTVSTQLVEAGIDISFDRVYRDLAPIDSIVQAAGRCNRSFERKRGQVTVWWLDATADQSKTPAEAVYNRGTSLLPVTANALESVREGGEELAETDVARTAVENYYRYLHEHRDVGKRTYADYVDDAKADELGRLSLIDQRRAVDIVVCRTDAERAQVEAIRDAKRTFDFEKLRSLLDRTKSIRISVPIHRDDTDTVDAISSLPRIIEDEGLYELDVEQHGSFFDQRIGFVVPDSSVDHLFI